MKTVARMSSVDGYEAQFGWVRLFVENDVRWLVAGQLCCVLGVVGA